MRVLRVARESFAPFLEGLVEFFAPALFLGLAVLAIGFGGPVVARIVDPFLACPIHVSTTDTYGNAISDYCLHLGVGR